MRKLYFNCDICIIKSPSNLYYFSGYENSDAVIIFTQDSAYYFTDARYSEEVEFLAKDFTIADINDYKAFISDGHYRSANIESSLNIDDYLMLKDAGIKNIIFIDKEIALLRAVKSEKEIEYISKAQAITDKAFSAVLDEIHEGMTERELAGILEGLLFSLGGEDLAFKSIVAFGENTSKPHAHRTDTKLSAGMPVTMDFGAKYAGYCSDMTRTVFFGHPSENVADIYNTVLEAQTRALCGMQSGMTGREIDALARDYFREKKLDGYFIHSLGHSLGIDIHESPNFSPKCETKITEGMVLSVEPGLYFAGKFGVRIEDIIYFSKNGIINLTKSPKNMIII